MAPRYHGDLKHKSKHTIHTKHDEELSCSFLRLLNMVWVD